MDGRSEWVERMFKRSGTHTVLVVALTTDITRNVGARLLSATKMLKS